MSIICKECGQVLNSFKSLTTHIQFRHDKKEYYDKYMKQEGEGFCKTCGEHTEFYTLGYGYFKFCCKKCQKIDMSKVGSSLNWQEISRKKEETNFKLYGVKHNMQRKEIMDQVKQTNLKKYGNENVSQNKVIKKRANKSRQKTCLKQYGVKNYFQVPKVQEKMKQTFLNRYGVENPLQDPAIFMKKEKSGCWAHLHPCGLYYRGSYEKDFLDKFADKIEIQKGLSFKYEDNSKIRVYHSDYYIPSKNLIVEIKNSYLAKRYADNIEKKKIAAIQSGYNWILIIDKNYSEFLSMFTFCI